ncbi:MAG: FeoB-associated Cys-rich membrane protein [Ruminococcus sp.]|nr:FeoB-associated Cys-rich membrane protein [Ruminococcus sp.]
MGTFFVALLLAAVIGCIIRYLVKQWNAGNGFCGGDCKSCGHCSGIRETNSTGENSGCSGNCASCKGCMHKA